MTKKIKQKLSNTLRLTFRCLKIIHFFHPRYYPKRYSKKRTKNKCVCFKDVIWLMAMIIRLKMKSIIQRYGINRPGPRHGHKCTNYQMCLSIRTVITIKQHLSNIWSSIYEKVKQHWGWIKESDVYKKSVYLHGKFCPGYAWIPPWTNGAPPSQNEMKNVLASYKRNNKFMPIVFYSRLLSRLVYHPVPALI